MSDTRRSHTFAAALDEPVAALASPGGAPAGATAAAWTLACAAALVEMSALVSREQDATVGALTERATQLRRRALELGDADIEAFAGVAAARRALADGLAREARLRRVLEDASRVPKAIVADAAELAGLAMKAKREARPSVIADLAAAAVLAAAACTAAAEVVVANLSGIDKRACDDARRVASYARAMCGWPD